MILICLGISWIAGIVIGFNFELPAVLILTGLLPLPLLLLKKYQKQIILAALCIVSIFSASVWAYDRLPENDSSFINFFNDKGTVTVIGMISDDPDVRDGNTRLVIKSSFVETDEGQREVEGKVLVFVPGYPAYSYGDVLMITGELKTPPVFEDFDYAAYLSHENIYSTMLYPQIKLTESGQGFALLEWVYSLRSELSQSLTRVLPEPQASLAQAMLLGIRSNIPDDLKEDFSLTGTAHLLAISGLHTAIVAGIMLGIGLALFGRRHYLYIWLALSVIWLYAILTGLQAPVVRSAIMASIFLAAELTGRQRNAITALVFAAAVMAACDPQVVYTASFQMSFSAMCGLIFILPALQSLGNNMINRLPDRFPTVLKITKLTYDSLAVTLAALAGVLPLIAYYFGIISIVSPLATLLILPVLIGIIVLGTLTAATGLFLLPLSQIFGWLLWLILSYMIVIVEGFAGLSIAYIDTGSFNTIYVWIYYIGLAVIIWAANRYGFFTPTVKEEAEYTRLSGKTNDRKEQPEQSFLLRRPVKITALLIITAVVLVFSSVNAAPDDKLHVSFLDIGQGDAVLLQKGNIQVLIDGGPSGQALNLALSEKMPFRDRTIELVVLTHPHDDHITGLVEVLKRYKVEHILTTKSESYLPVYDEWLSLIEEKSIPVTLAQAGQQINIDNAIIDVLNPQREYFEDTGADIDNNAVVLDVAFGEISFLLTADVGKYAELELITDRLIPQATILKVGHHGSSSSTSVEFLNVCRPQVAVISVGTDNDYGHPNEEVNERLVEIMGEQNIYRTDKNGTIEFISDGMRLWLIAEHW
ncbi:MAG TPA: DNA internalization-related competence protein ComEC/Rec2 [Dehalococcoidia bacterium]|nr:DNA internalization-related competence protein ComEC/Rec2 [Dehalococcoidia bacterium]